MRIAAAALSFATSAVALAVALAFAFGGVSVSVAVLALAGGLGIAALAFRGTMPPPRMPPPTFLDWLAIGAFTLAALRAFLWLLTSHDNHLHVLSPYNLGDLSLHIGFIRHLAGGAAFWPESPILTGETLQYPIGADLFNALLLRVGVPLEQGLTWAGLAGSALAIYALWRWGRGFAIAAFLFGGGLAGFVFLREAAGGRVALDDYMGAVHWKNLFLTMFVTQRAFLVALPAGLLLLDEWRRVWLRGEARALPRWVQPILYAAMPLFNVHAFLFLSVALAGIFVFARGREARLEMLTLVLAALIPATLGVGLVTGWFSAAGGVHWQPGWMMGEDSTKAGAGYWVWTFGIMLPLWVVLLVDVLWRGDRESRAIVLPATAIFLACCFISFAPWPWDNMKLMLWSWVAIAPVLWSRVLAPLPRPATAALCFVLFFTGAVSLVGGLDGRHGYKLIRRDQLDRTASALRGLEPQARFAAAPDFAHPLLLLGRKAAAGYDGHLWSHGLDYKPRLADLETLLVGDPGWEASARRLDVRYLYWGRPERQKYPESERTWARSLPVAAKGEGFTIYELGP